MAEFTRSPTSALPSIRLCHSPIVCLLLLALLAAMPGCSRLRHLHDQQHEMVYVWTRQMFLRDRVAAVSNHVAEVTNGQPLEVLEHGRRFLRVKTAKGEIGWIPDRAVIDAKTYSAFAELAARHKDDPVVADGTVRDDIYLHARPGRETDRFYLLAGDTRVKMLVRASVPREAGKVPDHVHAAAKPGTRAAAEPAPEHAPEPVAMEDWWLVRDAQNRVGWALGSRVDVNVPDDVAQYAEGQRMVGAYVIARVHDDEATAADHEVPEYVTALGPPKSGLPFDFDEIRVFTWSLKKHRYETAFRIHPIQGFLPVLITSEPALKGTEPVFSFRISSSPDVAINPDTGITSPVQPRTITYALRDTAVRRVGPDMAPIPIVRDKDEKAKTPPKKHR